MSFCPTCEGLGTRLRNLENPQGSVPGTFSFSSQISAVTSGVTVDLLTYAIPEFENFFLQRVEFGGSNIGKFDLYVNDNLIFTHRTWFGNSLCGKMVFEGTNTKGLPCAFGDVIKVKVSHWRPFVGDFEARIDGLREAV